MKIDKKNELLLSIIIPVYNVEQYVEECLLSVLRQKCNSETLEIIIVDDGTPDRSMEIVENLVHRDTKRVEILRQSNQGLSQARNHGLAKAKGKYVWFIDSDDYINSRSLEILYPLLEQGYDAITFSSAKVLYDKISPQMDVSSLAGRSYEGICLLNKGIGISCVPFTIFRRDILLKGGVNMSTGIFHEDLDFLPKIYYLMKKVYVIEDVLYYHRMNDASITHTINFKKNFDLLFIARSLYEFKKQKVGKDGIEIFNRIIAMAINNSMHNNEKMDPQTFRQLQQEIYDNRNLFVMMRNSNKFIYKIEGFLFGLFPWQTVQLYNCLNKMH